MRRGPEPEPASIFLLDNVRTRIESAVLEQNVLSPELSFRVLGQSTVIRCPNSYLWAITSNGASGTPDHGAPRDADPVAARRRPQGHASSTGNPWQYAASTASRSWASWPAWWCAGCSGQAGRARSGTAATAGRPRSAASSTPAGWASWFLANSEEAEAEMDQGLQDLVALAEHVATTAAASASGPSRRAMRAGKAAKDWIPAFSATQVLREQMLVGSDRSKATADRQVPGGPGRPVGPDRHGRRSLRRHLALSRDAIAAEGLLLRDRRGRRRREASRQPQAEAPWPCRSRHPIPAERAGFQTGELRGAGIGEGSGGQLRLVLIGGVTVVNMVNLGEPRFSPCSPPLNGDAGNDLWPDGEHGEPHWNRQILGRNYGLHRSSELCTLPI